MQLENDNISSLKKNNISLKLSVPSKTFLLGEYIALREGPSLIITTTPRFELFAHQNIRKPPSPPNIHQQSPAGKLILQYPQFYAQYQFQFVDPYHGLGGFGASSAQYLMFLVLRYFIEDIEFNDFDVLETFKNYAWNGEGMPPSGYDVIAQFYGGICAINKLKRSLKIFNWPFPEIEYCLLHTNHKIETHHHLKALKNIEEKGLKITVEQGIHALEETNSSNFIDAINNYANLLAKQDLVAEKTLSMLTTLHSHPGILAAKGCGALGGDVILIIYNKSKKEEVLSWLKEKQFNIITHGQDVADGMIIQTHHHNEETC